ncbi:unnamed protein product [Schistosoma mattheei]|uniref:Uncharacterized protein n=1 Tax=Schistosoma mattheei TaxID=31246 RepID=A0A183P3L7_9TREM|nr:unnamed protein product [Schistosoma mattheei]
MNFSIEIMNRFMLDHHRKSGSTGWLLHPSMGLFSSAHPRSCIWDSDTGCSVSRSNV